MKEKHSIKKNRVIAVVVLLIFLLILGYVLWACYERYQLDQKVFQYEHIFYDNIQDYKIVSDEDSGIYGITYHSGDKENRRRVRNLTILGKYFVNVSYRGDEKTWNGHSDGTFHRMLVSSWIEQFDLTLVSFKTGEIEKQLDMKVLLEDYIKQNEELKGYIYSGFSQYSIQLGNDTYIVLYFKTSPQRDDVWEEQTEYRLLFNVETEEFRKVEEQELTIVESQQYHRSWQDNSEFLELNRLRDEGNRHYISFRLREMGEMVLFIDSKLMPTHNEKLYQLFPELEGINQDDNYEFIILYIPIDENTTVLDILEYFVEDEVGIRFDGFTLKARESIDGQEHYIESREQFEQYYNGYWENWEDQWEK